MTQRPHPRARGPCRVWPEAAVPGGPPKGSEFTSQEPRAEARRPEETAARSLLRPHRRGPAVPPEGLLWGRSPQGRRGAGPEPRGQESGLSPGKGAGGARRREEDSPQLPRKQVVLASASPPTCRVRGACAGPPAGMDAGAWEAAGPTPRPAAGPHAEAGEERMGPAGHPAPSPRPPSSGASSGRE